VIRKMRKELQRKGARRGFTLVELLIVIIIIGILAGAMMLVAGTSRDLAEASKIISDLRNVKAAALMWIAENPTGYANTDWDGLDNDPSPLNKYLDRPLDKNTMRFTFEVGSIVKAWDGNSPASQETLRKPVQQITAGKDGNSPASQETAWFLGYNLAQAQGKYDAVRSGVKKNLATQAKSAGLYGKTQLNMAEGSSDPGYFTENQNVVYVIVQ